MKIVATGAGLGVAVIVAVLLLHWGPGGSNPTDPYRGSTTGGRLVLPAFALPRYDGGGILRSQDLGGRVALLTFVDSACKSSCPIIVGLLGQALRELTPAERRQVTAVAISVHPEVDTPANVRRFLRERHALGQLEYLVAPVPRMKPVWKRFHILSAAQTGMADFHSADVRIFDRSGVWVSTMHVGVDLTVANVLHDLREARRESVS